VLATLVTVAAHADEPETGTIRGVVTSEPDGHLLPYANVVVVGARLGAMALDDGAFIIPDVPVGTYTVRAMMIGYRPKNFEDVVVEPGSVVELHAALVSTRMSDEEASLIEIGADVHVSAEDFHLEVLPGGDRYQVGDSPSFGLRIRNDSEETVYLVRSLDGSTIGRRYPKIEASVKGPPGGFQVPDQTRCGHLSGIGSRDFVIVHPGESFDPFELPWNTNRIQVGHFTKPGRYIVRFTYSTAEADVREWLGPLGHTVLPEVAARLRLVPLIAVTDSIQVDVSD
jgi:hypothetical protein